jgi:hypothetical protein
VLGAFQHHRVSEAHLSGTTGYGYGDRGRDTLDAVTTPGSWARRTRWCGTALFPAPTPSQARCSACCARRRDGLPVRHALRYAARRSGLRGEGMGSLKDFGITYRSLRCSPMEKWIRPRFRGCKGR